MKEARETWPNKGRGADGRGQRHPATYTSQLNAQGFLNYPQTIKRGFGIHVQPAQGWTVQADLFAVTQLISLPQTCKPHFIVLRLPAPTVSSFLPALL